MLGVGDALGVFTVDRLDAQQGEIALRLLGRTNLPLHHVTVAQAEAANLAGADVNVVGAGKIVVFGAAQESEAIRQDFQHALAVHQAVLANARAENLENQVLLLESDEIRDALLLGDLVQVVHVHGLQVLDVKLAALDLLVFGIGFGVEIGNVLGDGAVAVAGRGASSVRAGGAGGGSAVGAGAVATSAVTDDARLSRVSGSTGAA